MTLTPIRVGKNLDLLRYEAENDIEAAAARTRARFATPGKYVIYDKKLQEATRYLDAVAAGNPPNNLAKYPYLKREVGPGKTAPTALALAQLWVGMNAQWEEVSATIEEISVVAKAQARAGGSKAEIRAVAAAATAALDAIGDKPPERPNKPNRRP